MTSVPAGSPLVMSPDSGAWMYGRKGKEALARSVTRICILNG